MAAAIVQIGAGFNVSTLPMPSAPVDGNLLVALISHYPNSFPPSTGWTEKYHTNGSYDGIAVFTRAASGDTSALTFTSGGAPYSVVIFEISGANAGAVGFATVTEVHDGSSTVITTTPNVVAAGSLTFGAAFRADPSVSLPTLTGPTGLVTDSPTSSASANRTAQPFHFTESGASGTPQPISATYATPANSSLSIVVFQTGTAAGGSPVVVSCSFAMLVG